MAAGAELPADVQAIFDKANAADASNDKPTALREYQTGAPTTTLRLPHPVGRPQPFFATSLRKWLRNVCSGW